MYRRYYFIPLGLFLVLIIAFSFIFLITTQADASSESFINALLLDAPIPPILVAPSGLISDPTPTFSWQADAEVDDYWLYVRDTAMNVVFDEWYQANAICVDSTCSVTSDITFTQGDYGWWVLARNSAGDTWSSGLDFTVDHPSLNEFVFSHTGSPDIYEFVEILGDPSTDYSAYTILEIEGDSSANKGEIDEVVPVGTTDANGFWWTDFLFNTFEEGTVTVFLVENFTGSLGQDLDTNEDGVLDVFPWDSVADEVAISDNPINDFTYTTIVLSPNYDGIPDDVFGASRIPNGTDTNSISDWVRNDFDGEGLGPLTGTPTLGEAFNTPNATNQAYLLINEIVFDHVGTDTNEFVELLGVSNADYSTFSLLQVEGDGSDAGLVDGVIALGTADSAGYVSTGFLGDVFENGTVSVLLVQDFSGLAGDDLDTNNDGVLDATPWARLLDDVAMTDGGGGDQVYSTSSLAPNFDGNPDKAGGASRIPNATDTDSANDWLRNNFDGVGMSGFSGIPSIGEALNTPLYENQAFLLINEFVLNHVGADTNEFVEVLGIPNYDYSNYSILSIEGDSGAPIGMIDRVYDVGTTDGNGYWQTGFLSDKYENGTNTLLLVYGFTEDEGFDLDTDNNGTIDEMPWDGVADSVAVTDGGLSDVTYSSSSLAPDFDGGSTTPGGASRIPNATDTDGASDWTRNDFDGEGLPGFTGTPVYGEAFNTPGEVNAIHVSLPVINEFVFNHVGADTNEFVEVLGDPSTDYSAYTLLVIDGDGGDAGVVDSVYPVSTTDASGYWTAGFFSDVLEDGTATLLLVQDFSGSAGADLDTNDDGTFDVFPWNSVIDDVGASDGGAGDDVYSTVALTPNYDGDPSTPGGASRNPNGSDTDTVGDWVRNDFDGEGLPGFTGTPDVGDAINTPGEANWVILLSPVINEFVVNHVGTDTSEFLEIYGDPNGNYSDFTILEIEGDEGSDPGTIDEVVSVSTMDGDGYWVQYFNAQLEDGSLTLLLVEDFSGSLGNDIDANDDGVIDSTPWSSIVDDVAVSDGAVNDRHYSSTVLISNYDGVAGQPGGASRLPNGSDTDALADWMRNDFDGEGLPGFTGTPVTKEAINTPGAENRGDLVVGFTSNSPVLLGELSTFTNTTIGSGPISYSWDFGDGSDPVTSTNPTHTYAAAGIYTVTLTATNQYESIEYSDSVEVITRLVAGFTSNSPVMLGELSTFTNTTVGPGTITYSWDFGDGSDPVTDENPTYTYAAAGTYTVTFTATNEYESDGYSESFDVIARLIAGFTSNSPVLLGELSTFTNTTTGPGTITYSWDFGDGSDPVTDENPTYTYKTAGTYTVTLTATNEYESDGYSESFDVIARLVAGFTSNSPVLLGELSTFTNTTVGPGTITYSWDFGDGSDPVTDENPTYTYAAAGTYTVTLTATNAYESDEYSESFDVIARLVAGFTSNSPVLLGELSTFTNTTVGPGTITYSWDFGDGSDPVTDENPTHTYAAAGTYTVTLTATNEYESDEYTEGFDVIARLVAGFTSNSPVFVGELSSFTNTTIGPGTITYSWDFGDGSDPVTDENPTYTYAAAGTYTVTLTATNEYESDAFSDSFDVVVHIVVGFTSNSPVGLGQLSIFTNTTTGPGTLTYSWDFGDGSDPVTDENPTHTYSTGGTFTVTLTATNEYESDIFVGSHTVQYRIYLPLILNQ